jgi:hypothetical protein
MWRNDGSLAALRPQSTGHAAPRSHALQPLADHHRDRRAGTRRRARARRVRWPHRQSEFLAYIEQVLTPTLRPGDVVVLDHLVVHKQPEVRAAVSGQVSACVTDAAGPSTCVTTGAGPDLVVAWPAAPDRAYRPSSRNDPSYPGGHS